MTPQTFRTNDGRHFDTTNVEKEPAGCSATGERHKWKLDKYKEGAYVGAITVAGETVPVDFPVWECVKCHIRVGLRDGKPGPQFYTDKPKMDDLGVPVGAKEITNP